MPIYPFTIQCPNCQGKAELLQTRNNGDRMYTCGQCLKVFGQPTHYALCNRNPKTGAKLPKYRVIEKDRYYNDCWYCKYFEAYRRAIERRQNCPHLIRDQVQFAEIWHEFPEYVKKYGLKLFEV